MAAPKGHTRERVQAFMDEIKTTKSDRAAAILTASVLEELLRMILEERFIELSSERKEALFDRMGAPLSSFSAKIEVAFAVGALQNEARLMLHLVRDVRNRFAHSIDPLTFEHPDIQAPFSARALGSVKALKGTTREKFYGAFSALAVILYGTIAAADIRVKSLQETHKAHFLQVMLKVLDAQGPEGS